MSTTKESYTRVELPESPASSAGQRNLTGLPRTVRDIAADIYNNIQRWNALHIKGASIVKEIALLKCNDRNLYPEGLEPLSLLLLEIINGKEIILNNLKIAAQQLDSLTNLHKSCAPLFISWSIAKIAAVGNQIYEAYKEEYDNKEFITENICHLRGKDKLMFYCANWTHQPYITQDTTLYLESFLTETGHRNKI